MSVPERPQPAADEVTVWIDGDNFSPHTFGFHADHPLGESGRIVRAHPVTEDMDAERHELLTVSVPAETLTRWQRVTEEFRLVQTEMLAILAAAEAEAAAREDAAAAIEMEQWEAERAITQARFEAARQASEAIAEAEDGPREWVLVTKVADRGSAFRSRRVTTGFTIHHHTCGILRRVESPSSVSDEPVRLPTAVDWILKPAQTAAYYEDKPVKACGRCARTVMVQVEFLRALQPRP